jgi:tetratricopeptide (TPR) repeat protein
MSKNHSLSLLLMLLLVILLVTAAYWPGLSGGFLFDDFINLPAIGDTGPIDNWPSFWRFITSGIADPTGRPLTLLTFLIDARDWPASPYPFKRTNLILHLINGALLYALLVNLGKALAVEGRRCLIAALLATSLWMLHPLMVSTTLYIVQREAMLPATCVLLGLTLWLHGRGRLATGHLRSGLAWCVLGLGGFTALGVLAKANGALLPLYALLIECIVLARHQIFPAGRAAQAYRPFLFIFIVLPSLAIGAYLVWVGAHGIWVGGNAGIRPWTYAQRLLTEPRVLIDYLSLLWLPRPFSSGLFNDNYHESISLLNPASTLPALLAVLALVVGAWLVRRRHPALALAVLFYFAGQLLESTSLPLELYFEHRNYVPALLMFWPLGLWLAEDRAMINIKRGLMILLPLGLVVMTHTRATVWGNVETQALVWAQINPESPRAQANAAQIEMQAGRPRDAIRRLTTILAAQPDQVQIVFNLIGAHCMTGGVGPEKIAAARTAMRQSPNVGSLFIHWFDRMLPVVMSGECRGLGATDLLDLINEGLQNPKLAAAGPQQDLTYLRGRIALAQRRPDAALSDFLKALDLQVRPDMALQESASLGAAGYPKEGLQLLDHYQDIRKQRISIDFGMPMLHSWVLTRQNYWPHELAHLRQQLILDAKAATINTARARPEPSTVY